MKKSVLYMVVLAGLFTSCVSSLLYKINTTEIKDIDGNYYKTSMPVYIDTQAMYYSDVLSISKINRGNAESYRFEVELYWSDWLFIDTLKLKINDKDSITIKDEKPLRKTIPGTVGTAYSMGSPTRVNELAYFILDSNTVNELKNCNTLVFQHKREPVTLPPEAIKAIKDFIK